jgi:arylsulfatase A-like enzyme
MRSFQYLVALAALLPGLDPASSSAADRPPNILLILADDLGYSDLGCYGGEIRTPNLDALATGGLRFTQFYNCTRCCPSRASILTGLYPHQAGVGAMTGDQGQPGYRGSLQPNCVTIAQVLKAAGYRTAMVGKWHVGNNVSPIARGFDNFYGWTRGYAVDSWEPRMLTRLPAGATQRSYPSGEFFATDSLTDHALDFLSAMRSSAAPWFLYVAYQAPHFPIQSREGDAQGYAEIYARGWDKIREERLARQKKLGLIPAETMLPPHSAIPLPSVAQRLGSMSADGNNPPWESLPAERRADLTQRMAVYAGMVTGMDRNVGRILADLRANHELENTLIFFLSDNGACAEWEPFGFDLAPVTNPQPGVGINLGTPTAPNVLHRGNDLPKMGGPGSLVSYGSGWANACNTPWRLYKHYGHEGGISTPLIVHWPARIHASGQFRTQPGHLIDIMATCVAASSATYPRQLDGQSILPFEGQSLVPALDDQPLQRDFLAWEHEGNAALRAGDWKLVRQGSQGVWELYNLANDRTELRNLAEQEPLRVQELASLWQAWARRTHVFPKPGENQKIKSK